MSNENAAVGDVRRKGGLGQRIAYACGNLGQAAFYNAMSNIKPATNPQQRILAQGRQYAGR